MMDVIVQLFPAVVGLAVLVGAVLIVSLKSKISSGATHAGSMNSAEPTVPGLTASAWDAHTIEVALATQPQDVVTLLESMATSLPGGENIVSPHHLGIDALPAVEHLVAGLENQLELRPLGPPIPPPSV